MFRKRGVIQISNVTFLILVGLLSGFNDIKTVASETTTADSTTANTTSTSDLQNSTVSPDPFTHPSITVTNTSTVTTTTATTNRTSTNSTTLSLSTKMSKTTTTSPSTSSTTSTPLPTTSESTSTITVTPLTSGLTETSRSRSSIVTTTVMLVKPAPNTSASHFTTSILKSSGASPNSSDTSTPMFSGSTNTVFTTSNPGKSPEFTPGMMLGVVLVVVMLIVIGGFILVHLKRRRKKSYKPFTKKSCLDCFKFTRLRSSSTTSHGPLTQDDSTSVDIPAANQDRELFSIGDQDGGNDGRPSSFSRPDADDDYFYDEIFEQSAFQDRTTRESNKHLTLSQDDDFDNFDDDELQLPDLMFRKPTSRI